MTDARADPEFVPLRRRTHHISVATVGGGERTMTDIMETIHDALEAHLPAITDTDARKEACATCAASRPTSQAVLKPSGTT